MYNDISRSSFEMETISVISLPTYTSPIYSPNKDDNDDKSYIIISFRLKIIIIILFILVVAISNRTQKGKILSCIDDTLHNATASINQFFHTHPIPRYTLMSIGSICIDTIFLYSVFDWALNFSSMRVIVCWITFYLIRGIIQFTFEMPFPPGYFWGNPYMPSLIVSYLDTNDFFFSGHVAFPLMTGLHYYYESKQYQYFFCFMTVIIEMFLVLITRVHYSIDIVIGLAFGHYIFMIVNRYICVIDSFFKMEK